jgi:hypothetical protein
VTDNLKDFGKIGYYCDVRVVSADQFFGRRGWLD